MLREGAGREPSPTAAILDTQSVKTTESGGSRGYAADDPRGWPRYHVRNASVTEIEVEPVPRVVALDVVDHLT